MKVEINGKIYCVETLIVDNERLRKDVIASADTIRLVLDKIRAEIEDIAFDWQEIDGEHESFMVVDLNDALRIIDKYKTERSEE